jgi:hypothetical protein
LLRRDVKFAWQRLTRGWDDSECWSLDISLAELILPRLKRFKQIKAGWHGENMEEWNEKLDKMIAFFEFASSDRYINASMEEYDKYDEGLKLFVEHYYELWS